ncbi:MAG TPA: tetratricopeptide repeat protein [Phycisphaerales bacterium]|nr:tetratricopeptide repeat protein [Phycisphaerales bacterium]
MRRSRVGKWRAAVLIGIHVVFAAHLTHWYLTGTTISPIEPSEGMELSKSNIINAGAVFFLIAIAATALLGRFFCGWGCHIVALQDLSSWALKKVGIRPKPMKSKLLLWVPLIAFLYMFVWPAAYRAWLFGEQAIAKWRGGEAFGSAMRSAWAHPLVFPDPVMHLTTQEFWKTFPGLGVTLLTFAACGFFIVYLLGAKGFCTYGCPYGAMFAIADKFAPGRIRVTDACEGCGHCTAVCTSNVRVHEEVRDYGMVVDPGCMKCLDCISVCPNEALYFGFGGLPAKAKGKGRNAEAPAVLTGRTRWSDYERWEEVLLGVICLGAFMIWRGLYGLVPFLLALGLSAMTAYLGVQALRLARVPNMTLHGVALKRKGRLVAGGWAFALGIVALAAFMGHSAFIQYEQWRGEELYMQSIGARQGILKPGYSAAMLGAADRAVMVEASEHLTRVEKWGMVAQPELNARLAYLGLALGEEGAFERRIGRAMLDYPRDASIRADFADFLATHDRPIEAMGMMRDSIFLAPMQVRGHISLGLMLASQERFEEARAVFDEGSQIVPTSADLAYFSGVAAAQLGDLDAAVARFEKATELKPGFAQARENLVGLYQHLGRPADAARQLRGMISESGETAALRKALGASLMDAQDWAGAERELTRALELEPGDAEAKAMLAELARRGVATPKASGNQ